ncbi:MAG: serine hydrolase, partial [Candidatus Pacebacteria bacterium]|nr:serine hydrolase [Candidatus Paceibacterota bacterium]
MISAKRISLISIVLIAAFFVVWAKIDNDFSKLNSFRENIKNTSLAIASETVSPALGENFQTKLNTSGLELDVKTALVKDLSLDRVLFEKNTGDRWPVASLTKIMTAIIAAEKIGTDKQVVFTKEIIATYGDTGKFKAGEIYSVEDLIRAMFAVSSNDAAVAIADFYGKDNFVNEMQKKAVDLGMLQTTFADASGLSFLNQSTAQDMEKMVEYVFKNHPEFLDISRQKNVELKEIGTGRKRILKNMNEFAGEEDFLGGKTGFIDSSMGNLISLFKYRGSVLAITVFGAGERF